MDNNEPIRLDQLSQRDIRSLIFQLLYALEGCQYDVSLDSIVDGFNRGFDLEIPLESSVTTTVQAVADEREALDEAMKPFLANWRIERLGVCTHLILRLALWELINTDTDYKIIINEAIEIAKCFAEKDAYKFINGVLDEFAKAQQAKAA